MSRARNRADGDFGDLDITNIGAVSLDSIKGDADGNTSLAFSGSDVITITTGGTTAATFSAAQLLTITDDLVIKSGGTIGGANDTDLLTLGNAALTVAGTLAATTGTFSGILKTDDATEATSTTDGSLQTDGGLSVVKDAVIGDDVNLLSDGSVLSFGASSGNVSLTHVIDTGLLLNSSRVIQFRDSAISIGSPTDGDLDINADDEIELNSTLVDVNANLDVSGTIVSGGTLTATTSIGIGSAVLTEAEMEMLDGITAGTAAANKAVVLDGSKNIATIGTIGSGAITSSGTIQGTTITATTAFVPDASDGAALGTSSLEFSDLFLADGAVISLGDDDDVTLTHVADTGILLSSTDQFQFGDSGTYIHQSADGVLDLVSDTEIEINATTIDINGNVEISGTTAQVGVSTSTAKDIFNAGMSVKNGATSAGFVEFFEDSDNGTNKVTVIGPASTADVTLTLPATTGTVATTDSAADEATALAIALG
jgi:hypothetical protein